MSDKLERIRKQFVDALSSTMTEKQRKKLEELMNDEKLPKHDLEKKLDELCSKAGGETKKIYAEIDKAMKIRDAAILKKLHDVEDNFTPETKVILKEAAAIHEDQTNSYQQEQHKMEALFAKASPIVKTDLKLFGEPFTFYTQNLTKP